MNAILLKMVTPFLVNESVGQNSCLQAYPKGISLCTCYFGTDIKKLCAKPFAIYNHKFSKKGRNKL
jgi:hypothetical protein